MSKFTQNELDYLTSWIVPKLFNSPFIETNKAEAKGWKKLILRQLVVQTFPLENRQEKLEKMRGILQKTFEKNLATPGFPAGKNAGNSFGENSSQFVMKLKGNSSTSAGGRATSLMTKFKSLLEASPKQKEQSIEIRFLKNYSYLELYLLRKNFQTVNLKRDGILLDYSILTYKEAEKDYYELFEKIYEIEIPRESICIRFEFSAQFLFNFQITLEDIMLRLQNYTVVPSPQLLPDGKAYIDVFVKLNNQDEIPEKTNFLQTVVYLQLIHENFGADSNVKEISINWDPISALIEKEELINSQFNLEINESAIIEKGLKVSHLKKFLQTKGWSVKNNGPILIVTQENVGIRTPTGDILEAVNSVDDFNNVVKAYIESSSGFESLIMLPDVDTSRCYTDAWAIMKKFYGIQTAKSVFINEMISLHLSPHYVSPVHISMTADFMTYTGEPLALSRLGHGKFKGPISGAYFEEQWKNISTGAIFNINEKSNLTIATFLGNVPKIGSGIVETIPTEVDLSTPEEDKNEEIEDLAKAFLGEETPEVMTIPEPEELFELPMEKEISFPKRAIKITNQINGIPNTNQKINAPNLHIPKQQFIPTSRSEITPIVSKPVQNSGKIPEESKTIVSTNNEKFIVPNRTEVEKGNTSLELPTTVAEMNPMKQNVKLNRLFD